MTCAALDKDEIFDLSEVLKNRVLGLGFDYVLIAEWLFDDDEQTGAALYEWLLPKLPTGKVKYVRCCSLDKLEAQLDLARREIPVLGIPIVHIEAHGEDSTSGQMPGGFVGPDGNGGGELLACVTTRVIFESTSHPI